jgi:hypothetical protein
VDAAEWELAALMTEAYDNGRRSVLFDGRSDLISDLLIWTDMQWKSQCGPRAPMDQYSGCESCRRYMELQNMLLHRAKEESNGTAAQ